MRFVLIPGNGCTDVANSNWYGTVAHELQQRYPSSQVVLENFPDPYVAREQIWLPFLREKLLVDDNTVVIGHSSGACAAMRLLEETKVMGCILVAAAHTDLGDENERASGYFNRPWEWKQMRSNAEFIHQFHSSDDPLIPVSEARYIAEQLEAVEPETSSSSYIYEELQGHSHFFDPFPRLIAAIDSYIEPMNRQL